MRYKGHDIIEIRRFVPFRTNKVWKIILAFTDTPSSIVYYNIYSSAKKNVYRVTVAEVACRLPSSQRDLWPSGTITIVVIIIFSSFFFGPLTAVFKILRRRTSRKNILLYTYVVIVDVGTRGNCNRRRVFYTDNSVFMVTIVFEYYGLFTHRVSRSLRPISSPPPLFLLPSAPFETQMVVKTS